MVGQHLRTRGVDTHNFALQSEDVNAAAKRYESGWSIHQLAEQYEVGEDATPRTTEGQVVTRLLAHITTRYCNQIGSAHA
jgi:hypothetical protein